MVYVCYIYIYIYVSVYLARMYEFLMYEIFVFVFL
jgi:hypothetical protein